MILRWIPWKFFVRHAARTYGFIDPAMTIARVRKFAQPSEFDLPLEIIRAAVIFYARGLVNNRAIQHNLDWVWPFWVEKQFDPHDPAFEPRSASFSHVNVTHRNWTAVGLPDVGVHPLVDPRGLLTPLHDGWSLDFWLLPVARNGTPPLLSSRAQRCRQRLFTRHLTVATHVDNEAGAILSTARVEARDHQPVLKVQLRVAAREAADFAVAVRPYNPEGVQFVDEIAAKDDNPRHWCINDETALHFSDAPDSSYGSTYDKGDVVHAIGSSDVTRAIRCDTGMATGAICFRVEPGPARELSFEIPLEREAWKWHQKHPAKAELSWPNARARLSRLEIPDNHERYLFESSAHSLLQLSAHDIYPGPYTYRRFWYRDACLMLHSLLCLGDVERCRYHLDHFITRQRRDGYFESQEGEWDSNGQTLWIFARFADLTGETLPAAWLKGLTKGIDWMERKRRPQKDDDPASGLYPAGFSAEHFGPNDFYFWDNFWAVGGLKALAIIADRQGEKELADRCRTLAADWETCIDKAITEHALPRGRGALPGSPNRRMDSGAIGVLVADYPLRLFAADDERMTKTAEWFLANSMVKDGFFQDMTHSGMNIYLTLDVAQTLLRKGDDRWNQLIDGVARMASPTGHWPEAVNPRTMGGCIGDGQHGWASAEWCMWLRQSFVREEDDELVIASGVRAKWLARRERIHFGPTLTPWGRITVTLEPTGESGWIVSLDVEWRTQPPTKLTLALPGREPQTLPGDAEALRWDLKS